MFRNNLKVIAFVIGFIFSLATLTGSVSAVNYNVNPGGGIHAVTAEINYPVTGTSSAENLIKKDPTNKPSKGPGDYHFKKQKQGIENLKTISTGGIPPKRLGEIIIYNIPRIQSMIKTVKTKITHNFSKFYKKFN